MVSLVRSALSQSSNTHHAKFCEVFVKSTCLANIRICPDTQHLATGSHTCSMSSHTLAWRTLPRYQGRGGLGTLRRDWHRRDAGPGHRGASLLGRFFRRQLGIPMHAKKAPTGDFPGSLGDEPEEWRHHYFWLDHLGAIEARFFRHHRSVGDPTGDQDVDGDPGAVEVLRVICLPTPPAAPVTIATRWVSLMAFFSRI